MLFAHSETGIFRALSGRDAAARSRAGPALIGCRHCGTNHGQRPERRMTVVRIGVATPLPGGRGERKPERDATSNATQRARRRNSRNLRNPHSAVLAPRANRICVRDRADVPAAEDVAAGDGRGAENRQNQPCPCGCAGELSRGSDRKDVVTRQPPRSRQRRTQNGFLRARRLSAGPARSLPRR